MHTATIDLTIRRGSTFSKILRWGQGTLVYKDITGIVDRAPLVLRAPGHDLPDRWAIKIAGVTGLRGINTEHWVQARVRSADELEINSINAAAMRGQYRGGGQAIYNPPVDMTGYSARMQVREYSDAPAPVLALNTGNGGIVIDTDGDYVRLFISAAQTEQMDWYAGVYDLEMVAPGGEVHMLARGTVSVQDEVTRP